MPPPSRAEGLAEEDQQVRAGEALFRDVGEADVALRWYDEVADVERQVLGEEAEKADVRRRQTIVNVRPLTTIVIHRRGDRVHAEARGRRLNPPALIAMSPEMMPATPPGVAMNAPSAFLIPLPAMETSPFAMATRVVLVPSDFVV